MSTFDVSSFIVGILLGMIILAVIVWLVFAFRGSVFQNCPHHTRECLTADYYNDPGNALINNPHLKSSDILFLDSNNHLFYDRTQKNIECNANTSNKVAYIRYPQYCSFANSEGVNGVWKQTAYNSNIYVPQGFDGPTITTDGNCKINNDVESAITSGIPLLRWDSNTLS